MAGKHRSVSWPRWARMATDTGLARPRVRASGDETGRDLPVTSLDDSGPAETHGGA